jgi:hypothetical protein
LDGCSNGLFLLDDPIEEEDEEELEELNGVKFIILPLFSSFAG